MMKLIIMPGPAFWAASAVSTKMPVPMTAPMPSKRQLERAEGPVKALLFRGREDRIERLYAAEIDPRAVLQLPCISPMASDL